MQRFKTFITSGLMAIFIGLSLIPALPASVSAIDSKGAACQAIDGNTVCKTTSGVDIGKVIKAVINILGDVLGVVAVIMIIIAGFKYVTSGGDASKISSAKNTLVYALVGLVVAALAQFLTHYVLFRAVKG